MSAATHRPNVSYGDRDVALNNEILRTVVGSGVHGVAIEGTDDHDEMGIFIEPRANVYGMGPTMDTHVWRTQPEGARSGPGDTDLVCYSLRKYLRLAIKGNPTSLLPLFAPDHDVINFTRIGTQLREMRTQFLSQEAVERFLGYMHQQHERMMGGGKRNRVPDRPELVEKYGWDVKYGSHALRLALQGYEIATTGHLSLPMNPIDRRAVLNVKTGKRSRSDVSESITDIQATIRDILDSGRCQLPPTPYLPTIQNFSLEAHEQHWFHGRRK